MIQIAVEACKGCGLCIEFCPAGILDFSGDLNSRGVYPPVVTDEDKCTNCGNCMIYCPDFALVVSKDE